MANTAEEDSEDSNINDEHQSMSPGEGFSDSTPASSKKRTITIAIAGVLLLSAFVFLSSDSTDEVMIVQTVTSACDETLITYSYEDDVFQETLYKSSTEEYATWMQPQTREMADGDVAVAVLGATNYDDSQCAITGSIWVTVDTDGDGDYDDEIENLVEIDNDGGVMDQYETIELSGVYVHDK